MDCRPSEQKNAGGYLDDQIARTRTQAGLVAASPKTPEEIARAYGQIIRSVWAQEVDLKKQLAAIKAEMSTLDGGAINLSDIVAGGNGFGRGVRGHGIHPATGKQTKDETGFIEIGRPDELIPVPSSKFIDGVFVPKTDTATVTSTGIKVTGITPTSGKTWDYFKFGPSSGSTANSIDGTDFSVAPHSMLAMHAMFGLNSQVLLKLMRDKDETLRGWAIQCALEKKKTNKLILDQLVKMAKTDESKFVRLYLASALQRLPLAQRWDLAEALIAHEADKDDHNLPLLYWYGIEPLVNADKARALKLTTKTKIPLIRQYIARRSTEFSELA